MERRSIEPHVINDQARVFNNRRIGAGDDPLPEMNRSAVPQVQRPRPWISRLEHVQGPDRPNGPARTNSTIGRRTEGGSGTTDHRLWHHILEWTHTLLKLNEQRIGHTPTSPPLQFLPSRFAEWVAPTSARASPAKVPPRHRGRGNRGRAARHPCCHQWKGWSRGNACHWHASCRRAP